MKVRMREAPFPGTRVRMFLIFNYYSKIMKPTFLVDQNFGGVGPDFLLVEGGDGEDGLLEVVPAPESGGSFGLVTHAQRTDA